MSREEVRGFVMDMVESRVRALAAKCTAQELMGVMGIIEDERKQRFNHYLKLIKGE